MHAHQESTFHQLCSDTYAVIALQICMRPGFNPRVRKIPWRRKWQPTPVFLPGEFHGQITLAGYSLWSQKESDMTERLTLTPAICKFSSRHTLALQKHVWKRVNTWKNFLHAHKCACTHTHTHRGQAKEKTNLSFPHKSDPHFKLHFPTYTYKDPDSHPITTISTSSTFLQSHREASPQFTRM